jgi:hypothetical protein
VAQVCALTDWKGREATFAHENSKDAIVKFLCEDAVAQICSPSLPRERALFQNKKIFYPQASERATLTDGYLYSCVI